MIACLCSFVIVFSAVYLQRLILSRCAPNTAWLCRYFLSAYRRLVNQCRVSVKEETWTRVVTADTAGKQRAHEHAFIKGGPHVMFGRCEGTQNTHGLATIRVFGGVKSLTLFKTTQSSFTNFHKDNNTSLPEATDRWAEGMLKTVLRMVASRVPRVGWKPGFRNLCLYQGGKRVNIFTHSPSAVRPF